MDYIDRIEETFVIKLGFFGLADEAIITVPFTLYFEKSVEENTQLVAAAFERAGLELVPAMEKLMTDYFTKKYPELGA